MDIKGTLIRICRRFQLSGDLTLCHMITRGNINTSWQVELRDGNQIGQYIVQKINRNVFPDPVGVMENIERITRHLMEKEQDSLQQFVKDLTSRIGTSMMHVIEHSVDRLLKVQDSYHLAQMILLLQRLYMLYGMQRLIH